MGSHDGSASGEEFNEREERLKERFLELEDVTDAEEGWDGLCLQDDEDDDARRERERREMEARRDDEERAVELEAIQEIYKRASKRAFRRLKNLPEPVPGCHYTGDGEDEEEEERGDALRTAAASFPGEGEDAADGGGGGGGGDGGADLGLYESYAFAAANSAAAYGVADGVALECERMFCHGFLKRSTRRQRRRRTGQARLITPIDDTGRPTTTATATPQGPYHTDAAPISPISLGVAGVTETHPHPPRGANTSPSADAIAAMAFA